MATEERLAQFLSALQEISVKAPFPNQKFVDRLYNKAVQAANVAVFKDNLPSQLPYGPDDGMYIDGADATEHIKLLAEQCAVQALSRLAPGSDKFGIRDTANLKAAQVAADGVFTQTSTMLFAEHVNWSLATFLGSNGSPGPDLKALRADVGFVNALRVKLQDPHFVKGAVREDLANGNHTYTMVLLFIWEYINFGPGVMPFVDEEFGSSHGGNLLRLWMGNMADDLGHTVVDITLASAAKASSLLHAMTGHEGTINPSASVADRVQSLASQGIIPAHLTGSMNLNNIRRGSWEMIASPSLSDSSSVQDDDPWQSMVVQNQVLWNNRNETWSNAISAAATKSTSNVQESSSQRMDPGTKDTWTQRSWKITTATGQNVADWVNQGRSQFASLFLRDAPSVVEVKETDQDPNGGGGSCFIAGTQVAVEGGVIAIEHVAEGTRVLSRADPATYGIASDEDVVTHHSIAILCGFNDEPLFFTPGHIFHTTSGLKAVNPIVAEMENHTVEVGRLAPGHILYRLSSDGKRYEQVLVKSIQIKQVAPTTVYGVHLRDGQRSYHANGYLVAVNYPEITVKSIAKMLATFSKDVRTNMLSQIDELKPLFAKFGAGAMGDVLRKEIKGIKRRPTAASASPSHIHSNRRRNVTNLRKARRTFALHQNENVNVSNYKLPSLSIHDGIVSVNGEAQARGAIDKSNRHIRWTRPVPGHGYEHGYVDVNHHGLAGNGVVLLSSSGNLESLPAADSAASKFVRFTASKPGIDVGINNAASTTKRGQNEHRSGVSWAASPRNASLRSMPSKKELRAAASMKNLRTAISHTQQATKPQPLPVSIPGLELRAVAASPDDPYIDNEDSWDVLVDQASWPNDTPAPASASKPLAMGSVVFATYHTSGGAQGLPVPIVQVPLLDQLLVDINKFYSLMGDAQLDALYSSTVEVTSKGEQRGTIFLEKSALLHHLADKPAGVDELSSLFNVTFKNIGSDVTLPLLYQTLGVQLSSDFSSLTGAATEYSGANRGGDGTRHFVQDSPASMFSLAAVAKRTAVSTAMAHALPQPSGAVGAAAVSPAPVTMLLAAETTLSVADLTGIDNYNSVAIHTTSQTLVQNMMMYHMNETDRTNFFQQDVPRNLPNELADGLQADLKTWLHDTYAPAFVSFMISGVKATDVKWRDPLTATEIERAWYWWNGQNEKCLARSEHYNELNALASVYATRQLYSNVLDKYITSADGPVYWANQMLDKLTNNRHTPQAVLNKPVNGGESILNKYCNIMLALDPSSAITDKYFDSVVSYAIKMNVNNPYFPLDKEEAEATKEWLADSMGQIMLMVLNNDPGMTAQLGAALKKDLDDFMAAENMEKEADAKVQVQKIVAKMSEIIGNMAQIMGSVGLGLSALIGRFNGMKRAAAVANKAITWTVNKLPKLGGFPYLKGIMMLSMTGLYIFQSINIITKWGTLSGAQRAIAIISIISMVVDIAEKWVGYIKEIKTWKDSRNKVEVITSDDIPPGDAVMADVVDNEVSSVIESEKGIEVVEVINKDITGDDDIRQSILDNVSPEDQDTTSADILGDGGVEEEIRPGNAVAEEINQPVPDNIPANTQSGWKNFTTSERVLRVLGVGIGIAFTIAMSLDLKDNWNKFTDAGKVLNVLQIVIQGLTVLTDVALLIGDAAVAAGVLAADATMMVCLPIIGAVLAVIGLVVMMVLQWLHITKPEDPPPTPVEKFISGTGRPLLGTFADPPSPQLKYDVPTFLAAGDARGLTVTASPAAAGQDATVTRVTVSLEVGEDDQALFSGPATTWTLDAAFDGAVRPLSAAGTVGASPRASAAAQLTPQWRAKSLEQYDLAVTGPKSAGSAGPLTVKSGESVVMSWLGTINKAGVTTLQIIETLSNGDKCRRKSVILRT